MSTCMSTQDLNIWTHWDSSQKWIKTQLISFNRDLNSARFKNRYRLIWKQAYYYFIYIFFYLFFFLFYMSHLLFLCWNFVTLPNLLLNLLEIESAVVASTSIIKWNRDLFSIHLWTLNRKMILPMTKLIGMTRITVQNKWQKNQEITFRLQKKNNNKYINNSNNNNNK